MIWWYIVSVRIETRGPGSGKGGIDRCDQGRAGGKGTGEAYCESEKEHGEEIIHSASRELYLYLRTG